jgi:hypothetical protein
MAATDKGSGVGSPRNPIECTINNARIKPDPGHEALVIAPKLTLSVPDQAGLEAALGVVGDIARLRSLAAGKTR